MITIQEIEFPTDCILANNDFYTYDPEKDFKEGHSIKYLNEDLLQCAFPLQSLIIDIGWFGDVLTNQGEFRIYVIQNENWQVPSNVIHSKSVEETKEFLVKILAYYTQIKPKVEDLEG
jgi:hypothetical protein